VLTTDARTVVLFDPVEGKELGRPSAGSATTLAGIAPLLVGNRDLLAVLYFRNHGSTLQCFDRRGAARWEAEQFVSREAAEDVAVDGAGVYAVCGGVLSAFALRDGKPLWQLPLPAEGAAWKLIPTRDGLLAYPSDLGFRRTSVQWLAGALRVGSVHPLRKRSDPILPVLIVDPETGRIMQRVNVPVERALAGVLAEGWRLTPSAISEPLYPVVRVTPGGLLAAVPGWAGARRAGMD
jgi:hypothetical protein